MDATTILTDDVVYFLAASIDGYIADKTGDASCFNSYFIPELGFHDFITRIGTVIIGRRSWDRIEAAGKWPYGQIPGIVATHRPFADIGAPVKAATGTAADLMAAARLQGPGAYWVVGGADIATQLLAAGALTRIELFTIPILLGEGVPAFRTKDPIALNLISSGAYPNGVTRTTWRPAEK